MRQRERSGTLEHLRECARVAVEKKGTDVVALDVRGVSSFTDYLLIVSGSSDRRVQAIAEAMTDAMRAAGIRPLGVEGMRTGRWVLIDFGDWVVNVLYEGVRGLFDLEGLWFDVPRVDMGIGDGRLRGSSSAGGAP